VHVSGGRFTDNSSAGLGGGAIGTDGGITTVSGSTFAGNTAAASGGAILSLGGTLTIGAPASAFTGNSAAFDGGAADATRVLGNLAGDTGGGVYLDSGTVAFAGGAVRLNLPNNCPNALCPT
jgi:predicted outer membrane repeat protein